MAWPVLEREADSMLNSLGSVWITLPVMLAFVLLIAAMLRHDGILAPVFRQVPAMRMALLAALLTAIVGFAVNDSGIVVPALAALIAVPLTPATALANVGTTPLLTAVPAGSPTATNPDHNERDIGVPRGRPWPNPDRTSVAGWAAGDERASWSGHDDGNDQHS